MRIRYTGVWEPCKEHLWGVICIQEALSANEEVLPVNQAFARRYYSVRTYLIYWGRRGTNLRTKVICSNESAIARKIKRKRDEKYIQVRPEEISNTFIDELEKIATWALLKTDIGALYATI